MNNESADIFEEMFYSELEHWLDISYFLCDSCVEKFINDWRGIYVNDQTFQTNSMPLDCLYSGSYLCDYYTLSEYKKLLKKIKCPHCGLYLSDGFIYPYEIPKGIKEHIKDIGEIAEISKKAPFIILAHPFATEIFTTLNKIFADTSETLIKEDLYRCRVLRGREKPYSTKQSGVVPDNLATEGRFNHSGFGFLYTATTKKLAFLETVPDTKISASMATIKILKKLKILDITDIGAYDDDIYRAIMSSSLLVNPPGGKGWNKPGYIFTRFIADCAIYLGFDGIKYNSSYNFDGSNLVVFKDKTNNNFNWNTIYKIKKIEIYRHEDTSK